MGIVCGGMVTRTELVFGDVDEGMAYLRHSVPDPALEPVLASESVRPPLFRLIRGLDESGRPRT